MIQSMTGFGSASDTDFSVEIRSLNHRYIDISIKMPPFMNQHEISLRNILKEIFVRGRFDVSISFSEQRLPQAKWNKALATSLFSTLQEIQKEFSLPGSITIETFSQFRDILIDADQSCDADALFRIFQSAALNLREMRIREGQFLSEEIRRRMGSLGDMIETIKSSAPDELVRWREKFTARLRLIVEAGMMDNSRILQEAAIMAEKLDISEEISRIEHHLKQMAEILDSGDAVGKKLDFLLQELNREVNTLASKAGDYAISAVVVEMKAELEKMREQVQNIQ
jgi:uncharacterized protein (TIGR00255 family)